MGLSGIDVSSVQGVINSTLTKEAGIGFVAIKLTEGTGYVNPTADADIHSALANGQGVILYHFARPDLGNAAAAEALYFAQHARPYVDSGVALSLDFERGSAGAPWALAFLENLQNLSGVTPGLYANPSFLSSQHILGDGRFAAFWLWLADWQATLPACPAPWNHITVWQHSDSGVVSGVGGHVDLDWFNGTLADLRALGLKGAVTPSPVPPSPTPVPPPVVTTGQFRVYIVKSGDTLSGIASAAGIALATVEADNPQLKKSGHGFNLIMVGEHVLLRTHGGVLTPIPVRPTTTRYALRKGDSLYSVAQKFGVPLITLERANPQIPSSKYTDLAIGTLVNIP